MVNFDGTDPIHQDVVFWPDPFCWYAAASPSSKLLTKPTGKCTMNITHFSNRTKEMNIHSGPKKNSVREKLSNFFHNDKQKFSWRRLKKNWNFCQKSIVSGSVFTFSLAFSRRQVTSSFRTNVSNMAIPSFRLVFFQSGIGGLSFPSPPVSVVGWVLSYSVSSASSWSIVGTENGSKSSTWSGLIGTQTRPETKPNQSINQSIRLINYTKSINQSINSTDEWFHSDRSINQSTESWILRWSINQSIKQTKSDQLLDQYFYLTTTETLTTKVGKLHQPVLGWTENGLLSKWFRPCETLMSRRG